MLKSLLLSIVGTKKEKNLNLPNTKLFTTRNYWCKNEKKTKTHPNPDYPTTFICRNKKKWKNLLSSEYKVPHNSQFSEQKQKKRKKQLKYTRKQSSSLLSLVWIKEKKKNWNKLEC